MDARTKLLLVGCGKMGGALLQRASEALPGIKAVIVDPAEPAEPLRSMAGITWLAAPDMLDANFVPDVVLIAIKPQNMAQALPAYTRLQNSVFLSIAAGQTLTHITTLLGSENFAIVRAMPNLPASIGQGMSVAVANRKVSADQRTLCDQFLKSVGQTAWVEDEGLMDVVTALSGSGPAYVFALAEIMAKCGEMLGLAPELAFQLARQTAAGSGALLAQSPESIEALRVAVTSPGGTTEAALRHLLAQDGLPDLMLKAMTAATKRARELSS